MLKNVIRGLVVLVLAATFTAAPFASQQAHAQVAGKTIQECQPTLYQLGSGFNLPSGNPCVKVIQQFMNEALLLYTAKGIYRGGTGWQIISVDGKFGNATKWSVLNYQHWIMAHDADGIVGPITWGSMRSECFGRWSTNWGHFSSTCYHN
jgi:hypothetical protein